MSNLTFMKGQTLQNDVWVRGCAGWDFSWGGACRREGWGLWVCHTHCSHDSLAPVTRALYWEPLQQVSSAVVKVKSDSL